MDKFIIEECRELKGAVRISGSKNSALPIMAATLLTDGEFILSNIPDLRDIKTMAATLEYLGSNVEYNRETRKLKINSRGVKSIRAPYELVKKMRASAVVLGPLLARFGKAEVSMPGGCAIGARPLNIHLKGFEELGAVIEIESGYIRASTRGRRLRGGVLQLEFASVGATENLMMTAVLAKGRTEIVNAAREPEIVDLANFLNKMGARIENAGESRIVITGVKKLSGVEYKIIPDRIETGTYIAAVATVGGEITIKNCRPEHLSSVIDKFRECGVIIEKSGKSSLIASRISALKPVNVRTMPHPNFPTDMQAQICAALALADGTSVVTETVFENRFMHIAELNRLGANIIIDRNSAIIKGVKRLSGAQIMATDLRASAALVIAGLAAANQTELLRVYHIDRGYEQIEKKFAGLGAKIQRVKTEMI